MTNKLPQFEGMTDEDEAVLRGAIARMNASDVEQFNKYERRIADLERRNELLRAVAEAARDMAVCWPLVKAAIDGGALEVE